MVCNRRVRAVCTSFNGSCVKRTLNNTQRITADWLKQSCLAGNQLLLEALLRRGFLAYMDDCAVWLGTGSHAEDIEVLAQIEGLKVEPETAHEDRVARVSLDAPSEPEMNVAVRIIGIPENRSFNAGGDGPFNRWGRGWLAYRNMVWGLKVATCPTRYLSRHALGYCALDIGVALLIKALPLARVATNFFSCDGHGFRRASIVFRFEWDAIWGSAVFNALEPPTPNSIWAWQHGVSIVPAGEYCDANVLGMLHDIQRYSRQLLDQPTIAKIGRARSRTLAEFGMRAPTAGDFAQVAERHLAEEFASGSARYAEV